MKISEHLLFSIMDGGHFDTEERIAAMEDALSFEECNYSKEELNDMSDPDLARVVYGIWADYAHGQM